MPTIYIVSDYGKMYKKGQTINLKGKDDTISIIFPYKTDQLIILGNVEITSGALGLLMKHNIDTIFLSKNGRFNGKLVFQGGKNVFLRQKQFQLLNNKEFKLKFASAVVSGKLKNQLTFMQRIKRRRENDNKIKSSIETIKSNIKKIGDMDKVDSLRGLEGSGARCFFSVFQYNIIQEWAVFNGRSMHPPEDNVNAVLSFLYTMLFFRVDAAIESEGLDSYAGYLHSLNYGKRALAFDLMEEYRTPIADTLCCSLFNLGILEQDDFEEVIFSSDSIDLPLQEDVAESEGENHTVLSEAMGVLLTKSGIRKVIKQLEQRLENQIFYPPLQKQVSYRRLIHEQVKHFKRVLMEEETEYKPLLVK